jgi:hypothetical protein
MEKGSYWKGVGLGFAGGLLAYELIALALKKLRKSNTAKTLPDQKEKSIDFSCNINIFFISFSNV